MADIHIDDFYKDVGKILLQLYRNFPRKCTVYVDDISGPDDPDEFGIHCDRFLSCFGAMVWLREEGYISFESTIRQEAIDQAILTHKTFLLLSAKSNIKDADEDIPEGLPTSVKEHAMTNVMQLRKALRTRSSAEIQRVVHYLLSHSLIYT